MKLVENTSKLHKTYTVLLSALLVILSILEIIYPYMSALESVIPVPAFPLISAIMGIAIGVGRYLKQDLADGKLDGKVGE